MTIGPAGHGISASCGQWFEGSDKPSNPGCPNRRGYWFGLNLIRRLRRTYSLRQLASWTPAAAQQRAHAALVEMARMRDGGASLKPDGGRDHRRPRDVYFTRL